MNKGPLRIEESLRERIDGGGKCLVPYITGGFEGFIEAIYAAAEAGSQGSSNLIDPLEHRALVGTAPSRLNARGTHLAQGAHLARRLELGAPRTLARVDADLARVPARPSDPPANTGTVSDGPEAETGRLVDPFVHVYSRLKHLLLGLIEAAVCQDALPHIRCAI